MNSEDKDGMDLVHPAVSTSSVPDGVHSGDSGVSAPRAEGSAPCALTQEALRGAFLKRYGYEPDQAVDEDVEDFNIFTAGALAALSLMQPLSKEAIRAAVQGAGLMFTAPDFQVARAVEDAHGIGGGPVA